MEETRLGAVETRFAELIWANAPLTSRELVALCERELEWKKSTTYTVLKRLCDRGLFCNENGTVKVLVSREDFRFAQGHQVVQDSFGGSLPAFIAAFTQRKTLTQDEISEIQAMIDAMGGK